MNSMWEDILRDNAGYFLLFGVAFVAVLVLWARWAWRRGKDESIYAARKKYPKSPKFTWRA